ncbi:hypothetical protein HDV62DRAFT_370952 [Trichoderma sp. SZMC 28011]
MSILVEHEAAITTIDNEGYTPFWTAIESSNTQKCSLLASKGVKVNEKNNKGQTGLIAARDVRMLEWCLEQKSESGERIWTTDELLEALSDCVGRSSDNNRYEIEQKRADLLLDEIDMATCNPQQAFTALRCRFEISFIDRILSARDFFESTSQVTDDDMWTLHHLQYHVAGAYSHPEELLVSEKPKGETLLPSALLASMPLAAQSIDTDRWEITTLSVTSKTTDNITRTFRANHPFPIRGERHAYFEAEASAPESQEGPVNFAIGLCGEFVDFGSSLPGTRFHPSIGFQSDDGRIFISAMGDQKQQPASQKMGPFAQSVKIGCGIDWNEKMIFFTRNGEIVAKVETPIIHWKLYPVVTVLQSTLCTINVNFSGDLDHPFVYKAVS